MLPILQAKLYLFVVSLYNHFLSKYLRFLKFTHIKINSKHRKIFGVSSVLPLISMNFIMLTHTEYIHIRNAKEYSIPNL